MANLFNQDFQDFLEALSKVRAEYILIGGYAVILHGYIRSTADMDVWVNKTASNYKKIKKAYELFGAPVFSEEDFLSEKFDVWGIGIEPNKIEVLNKVTGIEFSEAYPHCEIYIQNNVEIRFIHLKHLIQAKEAAGRFKDKNDVEQLNQKTK